MTNNHHSSDASTSLFAESARANANVTRRNFLRASGVVLTLPAFTSLTKAAEVSSVQRFAFVYTPNGYLQKNLLPEQLLAGHLICSMIQPGHQLLNSGHMVREYGTPT